MGDLGRPVSLTVPSSVGRPPRPLIMYSSSESCLCLMAGNFLPCRGVQVSANPGRCSAHPPERRVQLVEK